jgi:hypothetical protein
VSGDAITGSQSDLEPVLSASPTLTLVELSVSSPKTVSSTPEPKTSRLAVKRALLIGIIKSDGGSSQDDVLTGPHQDVMDMAKILTELYDYDKDDIVIMIDGTGYLEHTPDNVEKEKSNQPTRDDILRELKNLVRDPQPGDHFLLHYSGHSTQQPTESVREEDGLDELIMTCDSQYIVDDELREILVDPLPARSSLIAIFDTCHSATMLDLDHYRCNRVYTPWTNRRSDSRKLRIYSPGTQFSSKSPKTKSGSMRMSIDLVRSPKRISVQTRTSGESFRVQEGVFNDPGTLRCDSPVSIESTLLLCDGNCRERPDCLPSSTNWDLPYVMSVAACKDSQICWESPTGASMTQALIKFLRKDPYPPVKDLLTGISHDLYETTLKVMEKIRENTQDWEAQGKPDPCQDPQIASHKPLDMTAQFTLGSPWKLC